MSQPPVIIGSGIAGLTVALAMAPQPVIVLTRKTIGQESSSILAQGGIAAAMGPDDTPELHAQDTIAAGAGLCDPAIVRMVTQAAPAAIQQLMDWGVAFDKNRAGEIDVCLEGGHGRRRVVHADGDGTGAAVTKALAARALKTPSITVIDDANATAITTNANSVTGVTYVGNGKTEHIATDNIVLATGGVGALWPHTTNPHGSWGQGILLAARAGAALRDLEFVQFHPTGIDVGLDPMPLASESLRGEGAVLINDRGERFMNGSEHDELAPRDIVARAIWAQLQQGRRVFLDARMIPDFAQRFPTIYRLCLGAGLDPTRQPIPVRPTAHYHMGGVATDADGRTNLNGLWACGEVAATGLHGANRLASNSLLEAVVFGLKVAKGIENCHSRESGNPAARVNAPYESKNGHSYETPLATLTARGRSQPDPRFRGDDTAGTIRAIMEKHVGVLRDKEGLEQAIDALTPLAAHSGMALVGLMIATAALHREESRGAHCRTDFPAQDANLLRHSGPVSLHGAGSSRNPVYLAIGTDGTYKYPLVTTDSPTGSPLSRG